MKRKFRKFWEEDQKGRKFLLRIFLYFRLPPKIVLFPVISGKYYYIRHCKFREMQTRIVNRMESAPCFETDLTAVVV